MLKIVKKSKSRYAIYLNFIAFSFLIVFVVIVLFSKVPLMASCVSENSSKTFSHVILFSWDGVQYNHFMELYNLSKLINLKSIVNETALPILKALITDHYTETNYGHPSMLSGVGQGSMEGCPDSITVWENIETWNSSWVTGSIAGKAKFTTKIFPYAKDDVDFWYADDTSAATVTDLAMGFISNYSVNSFFLFIHYREPDLAAHSFGENSQNYENAIIECDNQMGRILSTLESEGIRNSTAILVTTDHGFTEGGTSHGGPAWGAPSSDPDNYIIWIACSAGTVNITDAVNEYWDQNDVAPTIYSLIGLDDYALRWSYIRGSALWDRTFDTRDVAIKSIEFSSSEMPDDSLIVNVSVENQGNYTEILTVSVYYDGIPLAKKTLVYPDVPLYGCGHGESARNVTFTINSTDMPPGDYVISAEVTVIAGGQTFPGKVYTKNETDCHDNVYVYGKFIVKKLFFYEIFVDGTVFHILTLSNSNVTALVFNQSFIEIKFNVAAKNGTNGFCNITIPKALMYANSTHPWQLFMNGTESAYDETENDTHSFVYFEFPAGSHNIRIVGTWVVPEYSSTAIMSVLMFAALIATILKNKIKMPRQQFFFCKSLYCMLRAQNFSIRA
jgi:hypothetical protein